MANLSGAYFYEAYFNKNAKLNLANVSGAIFSKAKFVKYRTIGGYVTLNWLKERGAFWDLKNPPQID